MFSVCNKGERIRTSISGIKRAYRFLTPLYYYNRINALEFGSYHHHIITDLGGHHLISAHFYQLSIVLDRRSTEFGILFIYIFQYKAPSESLLFSTIKLHPYIKIEQESVLLLKIIYHQLYFLFFRHYLKFHHHLHDFCLECYHHYQSIYEQQLYHPMQYYNQITKVPSYP